MNGNCYFSEGVNPSVDIIDIAYQGQDGHARVYENTCPTLSARDYKEPRTVAIPVLTPERPQKRQNGRRFKEDGDPAFTLTAQDRHGVAIRIKEATKRGYSEGGGGLSEPGTPEQQDKKRKGGTSNG